MSVRSWCGTSPILAVSGFVILFTLWQLLCAAIRLSFPHLSVFVPTPIEVINAGFSLITTQQFWASFFLSNFRVITGWFLACLIAIPAGVFLARSTVMGRLILPVLDFCRYIPVAAIVPLSILWLGVEERQKIAVLIAGTFFQALVLVVDAIKRVPSTYLEAGLTLGVADNALARRVLFPAAWPAIFDACRVCVGLTWSYLLVAELVAAELGLGYQIIRAQRFLKADQIFFVVGVLGLIGFCYDRALLKLRRYAVPWEVAGQFPDEGS